jgi:hypothetical protein
MRKRVWTLLVVLALAVGAGLVHAHGGLVHACAASNNASSLTEEGPCCPLRWLLNHCHLDR